MKQHKTPFVAELGPKVYKIDRQTLEERLHLIKQYVKTEDQMLQALYSLQHLANSLGHPKGQFYTCVIQPIKRLK